MSRGKGDELNYQSPRGRLEMREGEKKVEKMLSKQPLYQKARHGVSKGNGKGKKGDTTGLRRDTKDTET